MTYSWIIFKKNVYLLIIINNSNSNLSTLDNFKNYEPKCLQAINKYEISGSQYVTIGR